MAKEDRSRMNVPFRLRDDKLDAQFLEEAEARGLSQLKGHRSVGGMRASIYNAMPLEGVEALVEFMEEFRAQARLRGAPWPQYRIAVYNAISARGLERFPAAALRGRQGARRARRDPAALARARRSPTSPRA